MDETVLLAFMYVLVAFIVVLVILGVALIVFLRVILSAMSRLSAEAPSEETQQTEETPIEEPDELIQEQETEQRDASELASNIDTVGEESAATQDAAISEQVTDDDDDDDIFIVIENNERVRYSRSCAAKLCQLKKETREWYNELKNELLSYENVRARLSWRYETYRIGKNGVARFTVRGKTLCLLLAAQPANYADTKYTVEDVSSNASMSDTPTLYRIKSARRVKYAKEMIADVMGKIPTSVNPRYIAKDYFMPYEGDMALMKRGLLKRIVNNSTRKYKIEEIDGENNARPKAPKKPKAPKATETTEASETPNESKVTEMSQAPKDSAASETTEQ